jgi:hypothetical protein
MMVFIHPPVDVTPLPLVRSRNGSWFFPSSPPTGKKRQDKSFYWKKTRRDSWVEILKKSKESIILLIYTNRTD